MAERKYSVAEIDRMRAAVATKSFGDPGVEDRLRTYMLNGTDPDELEASVAESRKVWEQALEIKARAAEAIREALQG
jgi:hypothetical protein